MFLPYNEGVEVTLDVTINPADADRLALGAILPYRLTEDPKINPGTFRAAAFAGEVELPGSFLVDYADVAPRDLIVALCEDGFDKFDAFYCHEWRRGWKRMERRDRL